MSEDISFAEILKTKATEFKRPPVLPAGFYIFAVIKHEFGKSSKKQTPFIRYRYRLMEACEDVSMAELEDLDFHGREYDYEFYMTGKAAYRLTEFLKKCGVDVDERLFDELIPEAVGCTIRGYLNQRASNEPGSADVFNEISSFSAV